MPTIAYMLVFAAILVPAAVYFRLALREKRNIRSVADFFPLTRYVKADTYAHSTVAAGVSLATVILALVNLTPVLGISLLVTVGSYVVGSSLSISARRGSSRRIPRTRPSRRTWEMRTAARRFRG